MKALAILATFLFGCGSFVTDTDVILAIEKQGYTYVQVKEKNIFFVSIAGCAESDSAAFKVRAVNPIGKEVDILACAGWPFKGVTIRTK